MTRCVRVLLIILIAGVCGRVEAQPAHSAKDSQKRTESKAAKQPASDEGKRVFTAECSRCHNAPEQLNPRVVGTIARHMRVRANLSEADERALIRFFNP